MALFLKKHYYRTRGVSLDLIREIKPLIARAKKGSSEITGQTIPIGK